MNVRAILRRIRKLELQRAAANWKPDYGRVEAKLEALYAEAIARPPLTPGQIDAQIAEARAGHAGRRIEYDQLSTGPDGRTFAHLLKLSGEPDPRTFASPEDYAAAFGIHLRAVEDDLHVRQAGQAGRTEPAAGGGEPE